MPRLSERGAIQFIILLILLGGIGVGVYLVKTGNLKLFSKATNPPIVFKDLNGNPLPLNSSGIPKSISTQVKVEVTSTLGPPAKSGSVSAPVTSGTVSYRTGFDPTMLDSSVFTPYLSEPTTYSVGFQNTSGNQFYWVEFKDTAGKTDRRSAQIEIVAASGGTGSSFGKALSVKNLSLGNIQQLGITRGSTILGSPYLTIELWVKFNKLQDFNNQTIFRSGQRLNIFTETGSTGKGNKLAVITSDGSTKKSLVGSDLLVGKWNHVALTFIERCLAVNVIGCGVGDIYLHANGQTFASYQMPFKDDLSILEIGKLYDGEIDELMIRTNAPYYLGDGKTTYTVPTGPFVIDPIRKDYYIMLFHLDGDAQDVTGHGYVGSVQGGAQYIISDNQASSSSPYPTLTPSPTPTSSSVTVSYPLPDNGWNLIGIPVYPAANGSVPYSASNLLAASGCVEAAEWNNQAWRSYINGSTTSVNFPIQSGTGYFIRCDSSGKKAFNISGLPNNNLPSLSYGWNAVAAPYNTTVANVKDFVNGFSTNIKSNIKEVDRYEAGGWESFLVNIPPNNFPISNKRGYFIKYTGGGSSTIGSLSVPITTTEVGKVTLTPPTNSPVQKASGAVTIKTEKGVGFFANYVRFNLSGTFSNLVSKTGYQVFLCRKNNGSCGGGGTLTISTDAQGNGKLPQGATVNLQGNAQDFNTVILTGGKCPKVTAPCLKGTF